MSTVGKGRQEDDRRGEMERRRWGREEKRERTEGRGTFALALSARRPLREEMLKLS